MSAAVAQDTDRVRDMAKQNVVKLPPRPSADEHFQTESAPIRPTPIVPPAIAAPAPDPEEKATETAPKMTELEALRAEVELLGASANPHRIQQIEERLSEIERRLSRLESAAKKDKSQSQTERKKGSRRTE